MSGRADKRDDHQLCGARSPDAQTEGRGQDDSPRLHGELSGSSQHGEGGGDNLYLLPIVNSQILEDNPSL